MCLTEKMEQILAEVLEQSLLPHETYCKLVRVSLTQQLSWGDIQKVIAEADRRSGNLIARLYPDEAETTSAQTRCARCDEASCSASYAPNDE